MEKAELLTYFFINLNFEKIVCARSTTIKNLVVAVRLSIRLVAVVQLYFSVHGILRIKAILF